MPGLGGLVAIRRWPTRPRGAGAGAHQLLVRREVVPAIRAGAAGYLLEDAHPSQVEAAIRTVGRGERLLDPQVAAVVMAEVAQPRAAARRCCPC